jgi:hypothetical protein
MFRAGWERFARLGFFLTKDLDADAGQPGIRVGITGPLMAFAARAGYDVVAVDPVRLNAEGSGLEPAAGDRANRGTWESVRITLAKDGRRVLLDYVRMDLSDAHLARHRASRTWIEAVSANRTVLKSASHLPQHPQFSILRNAIVSRAPSIWQDETGIEYDLLARTHAVACTAASPGRTTCSRPARSARSPQPTSASRPVRGRSASASATRRNPARASRWRCEGCWGSRSRTWRPPSRHRPCPPPPSSVRSWPSRRSSTRG